MTLDELLDALRRYCAEHHPAAAYAALVIHLADGVPDLVLPVAVTPPSAVPA